MKPIVQIPCYNEDYVFAQNSVDGVIINPSQNFPFWTIKRITNSDS